MSVVRIDLTRAEALELTRRINEQMAIATEAARQLPPPRRKKEPAHTYFIRAERSGLIKIGCASDPVARLRGLATGSPEPLRLLAIWRDGGREAERQMHELFASFRSHGEWFYPSEELYAAIKACR